MSNSNVTVRIGSHSSKPISVKVGGVEISQHLCIRAIGMPTLHANHQPAVLQLELRVDEFEFETGNLFEAVLEEGDEPGKKIVRLRSIEPVEVGEA